MTGSWPWTPTSASRRPCATRSDRCARGACLRRVSHPARVFYLGRWIRATDWYPDSQIRIFDRRHARWEGALVHESVRVQGRIGRLRAPMEHYPYADISAHMRKIDRYTTLWARQAFEAGRRTSTLAMALIAPVDVSAQLCPEARRAARTDGPHGLDPQRLLHLSQAREARRADPARGVLHGSMRVLHVDTALSWRGGQNQVLLTARGMVARGHAVAVACRRGGALETRLRGTGIDTFPIAFRGEPRPWAC